MLLNINQLFRTGFATYVLPDNVSSRIKMLIDRDNWVDREYKENIQFKSLPKYMLRVIDGLDRYERNDSHNTSFVNQQEKKVFNEIRLKEDSYQKYFNFFKILFHNKNYCGDIDKFYKLSIGNIYLVNGVSDWQYHWDGGASGDIFALIYLTDYKKWPKEYGAGFCGGKVICNAVNDVNYSKIDDSMVEEIFCEYPENGRVIFGVNNNPTLVHKPLSFSRVGLEKKPDRFTFLIKFTLLPL